MPKCDPLKVIMEEDLGDPRRSVKGSGEKGRKDHGKREKKRAFRVHMKLADTKPRKKHLESRGSIRFPLKVEGRRSIVSTGSSQCRPSGGNVSKETACFEREKKGVKLDWIESKGRK